MQTNNEPTTEALETTPDNDTGDGPKTPRMQALATEYATGSDGHLYVTGESFKPGATDGRKQFIGYRLSDEEAAEVWEEINRQAFNATQAILRR
ncbi:hypothetical protein [Polyangium mundeleinium]|uniref:Uncharacterized protein n=1 Tax=Polyangium mundeleinium TaxID=2995306 RepID=A0ABT5F7U3_9BACT|nr:hypothetical protein [Polyangium mundeleinium]MDC0750046.1 hypothetical protein [Polyangium mundeleinium]